MVAGTGKKGGKHAEIASQLRAAGPANTGSRNGHHVDVYKKLAAENAQLFEETQRESLLKHNYNPAMKNLQSESLRQMINNDKSLQEMMFSTSVQHGGGGAAKIFNRVYKEGMSREDLINSVYAARGGQFSSSTSQVQASVNERFKRERDLIMGMNRGEANVRAVRASMAAGGSEALNAGMSSLVADATQRAMDNGVKYKMGAKNSARGQIDCSGWVQEMSNGLMSSMNQAAGQEVFSKQARKAFNQGAANEGAAGIIRAVSNWNGGHLLTNNELTPDQAREGMVIGLAKSGDRRVSDRFKGIGHIVQTYRDPQTGELMVSESRGGKGVMNSKYSDWYAQYQKKGYKMYGSDLSTMADASKIAPAQTAVAEAKTEEKAPSVQATGAEAQQTADAEKAFVQKQAEEAKTALAENKTDQTQAKTQNTSIAASEEKTPPTSVASAETQQATNPEIAQAQYEAKTQATVVADASKSAEAASTATQQVAEALPKAATTVANTEPVSPQPQQSQNAAAQRPHKREPSQVASAGPIAPREEQEAPKPVAFAQNGPMQSLQSLLSQTGSFFSKIPGLNSNILAPVQNVFGKVQAAMDMVKSPEAMIDNFLPKEAQPLVANVQKVAGDFMPLANSIGSLLPGSASPFLSGAQNILGQIAKPQFPSSLPDPAQFFGQPLQIASNVMQAMPQIPTRLPDPAELMPTQSMQQSDSFDVGPIVNVLTELLDVTKKNTQDREKDVEGQNSCNIPMDFDDAYCFRFAHDMALG